MRDACTVSIAQVANLPGLATMYLALMTAFQVKWRVSDIATSRLFTFY